jgi:hypothetical protein
MLDHDRLNLGIGQEFEELGMTSVPAATISDTASTMVTRWLCA